ATVRCGVKTGQSQHSSVGAALCRSTRSEAQAVARQEITIMSREPAGESPLGGASATGNRLVSEPAFELLFSEIIAYTGAYVSHSAASHATDLLRASEAEAKEGQDNSNDEEDGVESDGALVKPSPASVGAGNHLLPPDQAQQMEIRIEGMGYEVGYRLVERACQRRWMGGEQLEAIKFVCKDLWSDVRIKNHFVFVHTRRCSSLLLYLLNVTDSSEIGDLRCEAIEGLQGLVVRCELREQQFCSLLSRTFYDAASAVRSGLVISPINVFTKHFELQYFVYSYDSFLKFFDVAFGGITLYASCIASVFLFVVSFFFLRRWV
ncbi:unnamed protein product, partial [Pylaiella littoralis]